MPQGLLVYQYLDDQIILVPRDEAAPQTPPQRLTDETIERLSVVPQLIIPENLELDSPPESVRSVKFRPFFHRERITAVQARRVQRVSQILVEWQRSLDTQPEPDPDQSVEIERVFTESEPEPDQ